MFKSSKLKSNRSKRKEKKRQEKTQETEMQQNDDRITPDYQMELKTGYSTFKLFPEDPNKPEHQHVDESKNNLMRLLVGHKKKKLKFAERIHYFKGK